MYVILADNQDITRAGMMYVCQELGQVEMHRSEDKVGMIEQLKSHPDAVVVLDYTLYDINDVEELEILYQRFPDVQWILFSVDLSGDFVRRVIAISPRFSILLKESPIQEIRECLLFGQRHQRYICQRMAEILLAPQVSRVEEDVKLTPTEVEILKDIALGLTTKEIAERRFSSFHTVNTHRKNIFRKIGVNNVHEATKYALRAGLVDSAEYYI
ncbi:MAG: response regulator transcription factor [Prevotella sp.]|nr:response regulator transcription factor [Prevotella sp.]